LTTFIDHRPHPGGASPYERPTTDQINFDGLLLARRPERGFRHADTTRARHSPKRCSTILRPRQKRPSAHGGFKSAHTKYKPENRSLSRPARRGIPTPGLSKPFVEPLFTCQRTPDSSGPPNAGETIVQLGRRQTHSNSASSRLPVVPAT
jgi:hypothetical protein